MAMIVDGLVWFGLVWFYLVWFGLVWFGFAAPNARGERSYYAVKLALHYLPSNAQSLSRFLYNTKHSQTPTST
jgi:hypothetical protein